ncbi:glycosyltransferase family 2 protein [Candidatus Mesenet endosymbiont of Phosphuga atrata]|uniref:glycosyltransferase family 2 protein n=1 Tax=Candidatus Mesenet endosymbiont of Phosphuga atrata TaxID=3066221 RepID=UPI0030CD450A
MCREIDISKIKLDYDIWGINDKLYYYKFGLLPWQRLNNITFIIVSDIDHLVIRWLKGKYSNNFILFKSDYNKIISSLNAFFGYIEFSTNYLYYKNDKFSAKDIKFGTITYVIFTLLISILALTKGFAAVSLLIILFISASSTLFRYIIILLGFCNKKASSKYKDGNELPVYTILLPILNENKVIKQLIDNINNIDYPKSKLDIKLIIEEDDKETIWNLKEFNLPENFETIIVPNSFPKTKSKACNYALCFSKGEYVVIYDADDIPDPLQLKKALAEFKQGDSKLACVQAKLGYYNYDCNLLTKFFSLEYISWFHYLLRGMQKINIPIPLGGSSNHFRMEALKKVYLWDAYNVTEDADLGLRLAAMGYYTKVIDSETLEESPINIFAWIKQRARWIKGYVKTYIVHMKNLKQLYKATGLKGILLLNLFVGSTAFTFFTTPFLFTSLILVQYLNQVFLYYLTFMYIINTVTLFAIIKEKKMKANFYLLAVIFPIYWLLHSVASAIALWELIKSPQRWNKTKHGFHL